jgi:hypothetical protein
VTAPNNGETVAFTARVDPELVERTKRAVYWQPGVTIGDFVGDALRAAVEEAEAANGGPFKPIPAGRRVRRGPRLTSRTDTTASNATPN